MAPQQDLFNLSYVGEKVRHGRWCFGRYRTRHYLRPLLLLCQAAAAPPSFTACHWSINSPIKTENQSTFLPSWSGISIYNGSGKRGREEGRKQTGRCFVNGLRRTLPAPLLPATLDSRALSRCARGDRLAGWRQRAAKEGRGGGSEKSAGREQKYCYNNPRP